MPKEDSLALRVQELEDREQIRDVLNRYAEGIRVKDPILRASSFAEDAVVDQNVGTEPLRGHAAIVEYFARELGPDRIQPDEHTDGWVGTTPIVSDVRIDLNGDTAHAESTALACRIAYKGGQGELWMRYWRNIDDLARTQQGWKIQRRSHVEFWGFKAACTPNADGWNYVPREL